MKNALKERKRAAAAAPEAPATATRSFFLQARQSFLKEVVQGKQSTREDYSQHDHKIHCVLQERYADGIAHVRHGLLPLHVRRVVVVQASRKAAIDLQQVHNVGESVQSKKRNEKYDNCAKELFGRSFVAPK
jgi:hypothetical protein